MCVLTRSLLKRKQADELLSTARRLCSITYNANSELVNSCLVKHPFVRLRLQLQLHLQPQRKSVNQPTHTASYMRRNSPSHHPNNAHSACLRPGPYLPPPGSRQHHRTSPCFSPRVPRPLQTSRALHMCVHQTHLALSVVRHPRPSTQHRFQETRVAVSLSPTLLGPARGRAVGGERCELWRPP